MWTVTCSLFPKNMLRAFSIATRTRLTVLNASGESAGQSVPHFHIHIIPRKNNDGIDAWPKFDGAKDEVPETWKKLKL